MIYFSGISTVHFQRWSIPDDTPLYASVDDCHRLFLGMHLRMMRHDEGVVDPYYNRYLACVEHFRCRLKLSYQEFRNVVAVLVALYGQYSADNSKRRRHSIIDKIGKFERLIFMYTNKTFPSQSSQAK